MRWLGGLFCAMLAAGTASGHDLGVECTFEGDVVRVEVYYDDGAAAEKAAVRVFDGANRAIASGETDDTGVWTFPRPPAGKYRVEADAGQGHRRNIRLTVPSGADEKLAADQPSKAEFTRSRWPQLIAGLAIIAAGAAGLRRFLRNRQGATPTAISPDSSGETS